MPKARDVIWHCGRVRCANPRCADEEGRAEKVESHKQESIKNAKDGKAAWKDELASDSESIVGHDILRLRLYEQL